MDARARIGLLVEAQNARRAAGELDDVAKKTGQVGDQAARSGKRMSLARGAADKFGSAIRGLARMAKYGAIALAGMTAVFAKKAVGEWRESAQAMRGVAAAIKSSGGAAKITAKEIGNLSDSLSLQAGIDDEMIQSGAKLLLTFRKVRNEAGKNNDIFNQSMQTALDMSAAYDQSLKASITQLGKAMNEPAAMASALKRTGAVSNEDVERLKEMEAAGASLLEQQKTLLKMVNRAAVKGQAAAMADPFDKVKVAVDNLAESFGYMIGPPLARAATAVAKFVNEIQSGTGAGGRFAADMTRHFNTAKTAIGTAISAVRGYLTRNAADVEKARQTFRDLGTIARWVFEKVWLPTVKRVLPIVTGLLQGWVKVFRGVVNVFSGLIKGDFSKVWEGIKQIFSGGMKALRELFSLATLPLRTAAEAAFGVLKTAWDNSVGKVLSAAKDAIQWIIDKLEWAADKAADVAGMLPDLPGTGSAGDTLTPEQQRQLDGGSDSGYGRGGDDVPLQSQVPPRRRTSDNATARAGSAASRVIELHSHHHLDGREILHSVRRISLADLLQESPT